VIDEQYRPQEIEETVQRQWESDRTFQVSEDPARAKFYCLSMFPYPSGRLHMGHVRNYTIGDVISRYQRMCGRNVLQPMGWDAFGLPAEGAAIKHGMPPARWTYENIAYMKRQLRRLGFGYDWSREIATCQPEYYRWEQWFFTRLFRKKLVYKKNAVVNWDPVDNTVLANEQVIDGRGWRSGALVERREIPQWFLNITAYAQELLDELEALENWPESVRTMQRNWIGRSEGVEVDFQVAGGDEVLSIFTTRPDTLMGVTYMAVAAEHPLAQRIAGERSEVAGFIEECRSLGMTEAAIETAEKRGAALGVDAIHPLTGERVPVWIANFVLMSYGTGAVMAVPGHDQRDWEFARAYGLPIRQVIAPWDDFATCNLDASAFTEEGVLVESGEFNGLGFSEAYDAIADVLERRGHGRRRVHFRLRDWGISRQRYWGTPIPIINCEHCGAVPVPDDQLPVLLPEDVEFDGSASPLTRMPEFYRTVCPECGRPAERETDTFDTFVESSWYFARFASPDAGSMVDERARYWLPVDQYVGGIEHAILHLLYARYFNKLMRDAGLLDNDEPFSSLLTQGMVVAETYLREDADGKRHYHSPAEVSVRRDDRGKVIGANLTADGQPVIVGGIEKMSKSKNNGVDPQDMIDRFGADTVRLYMMFTSPPDQSLEWSDAGVEGASRFLRRLWRLAFEHLANGPCEALQIARLNADQREFRRLTHETIAKVGDDLARRRTFNTAIAAVMELCNAMSRRELHDSQGRAVLQEALEAVVKLLSPITPHICQTLWSALGGEGALVDVAWPAADPAALERDSVELVLQVNGKLRGRVVVPRDADQATVEEAALAQDNVQRFVAGKAIRRIIVVPGKLVNVVC
jgi:leucyl-tRNA synthetase